MSVAFITHADCLKHEMGAHHPERPERLTAIEDQRHDKVLFIIKMTDEPLEQDRACVGVAFAAATKRI